jgi:hypothetical protein
MKLSQQKLIGLGLVLVFLSGCATAGSKTSGPNPDDPAKTDATRTKVEGAVVGTAVGAGVGAAIGAAAAGRSGAAVGAAIGAAAGLIGGTLAGIFMADRKQKYVDAEQRLDKQITLAADANARLRDYNAQAETRMAAMDKEISDLKASYAASKVRYGDLEQKQQEIRGSISDAEQQKNGMEKELNALNEYLASIDQAQQQQPKAAQLQKEVDELKANIAMLDNNNKQMAKMADSLTVRK